MYDSVGIQFFMMIIGDDDDLFLMVLATILAILSYNFGDNFGDFDLFRGISNPSFLNGKIRITFLFQKVAYYIKLWQF